MKSTCAHLGVVALALVASSCASAPATLRPAQPPVVDTIFIVDTLRVETESAANPELQAQINRLQFQILERNVQLEGMQEQLDATRQEVVRNLAKLQSQANRAEAASGMAEAEIALESLRRAPGGEDLPEFAEERERIEESSTEFGDENFGGALYLAT